MAAMYPRIIREFEDTDEPLFYKRGTATSAPSRASRDAYCQHGGVAG